MDALKDVLLGADGAGYSGDQDTRVDDLKVCLLMTFQFGLRLLLHIYNVYVYILNTGRRS